MHACTLTLTPTLTLSVPEDQLRAGHGPMPKHRGAIPTPTLEPELDAESHANHKPNPYREPELPSSRPYPELRPDSSCNPNLYRSLTLSLPGSLEPEPKRSPKLYIVVKVQKTVPSRPRE